MLITVIIAVILCSAGLCILVAATSLAEKCVGSVVIGGAVTFVHVRKRTHGPRETQSPLTLARVPVQYIGVHNIQFHPAATETCLYFGGHVFGGEVDGKVLAVVIECTATFINVRRGGDRALPLVRNRLTCSPSRSSRCRFGAQCGHDCAGEAERAHPRADCYSTLGSALLQACGAAHVARAGRSGACSADSLCAGASLTLLSRVQIGVKVPASPKNGKRISVPPQGQRVLPCLISAPPDDTTHAVGRTQTGDGLKPPNRTHIRVTGHSSKTDDALKQGIMMQPAAANKEPPVHRTISAPRSPSAHQKWRAGSPAASPRANPLEGRPAAMQAFLYESAAQERSGTGSSTRPAAVDPSAAADVTGAPPGLSAATSSAARASKRRSLSANKLVIKPDAALDHALHLPPIMGPHGKVLSVTDDSQPLVTDQGTASMPQTPATATVRVGSSA